MSGEPRELSQEEEYLLKYLQPGDWHEAENTRAELQNTGEVVRGKNDVEIKIDKVGILVKSRSIDSSSQYFEYIAELNKDKGEEYKQYLKNTLREVTDF